MNISFKKDMYKSYMVIEKVPAFSPHHFMMKMLSENEIPGLLKSGYENLNGQYNMLYDISSKQAFSKYFEKEKMSFDQVKALLLSLRGLLRTLREYLLDADNIILKQECIFTDPEGKHFSYCYYPYYNGDLLLELRELFTKLLSMVNYDDERAVRLVIELQNGVQAENVTIEDLMEIYHRVTEGFRPKVQKIEPPESAAFLPPERKPIPAEEKVTERQKSDWDFLDDDLPFFEKVKCYLKGKKFMDVLEDINNREFLEKVRQCGRPAAVEETFRPEEALPAPEKPAFEYITFADGENVSTVAEPEPYRTQSPRRKDPFLPEYPADLFAAASDGTVLLGKKPDSGRKLTGLHKQQGVRILLTEFPFTVGSSARGCDAQIEEDTISRMHARFYKEDGQYYVEDLNSMNGTYLNDERLESYKRAAIREGDILRFAEEEFCFR